MDSILGLRESLQGLFDRFRLELRVAGEYMTTSSRQDDEAARFEPNRYPISGGEKASAAQQGMKVGDVWPELKTPWR
jgi:hypothetical protein